MSAEPNTAATTPTGTGSVRAEVGNIPAIEGMRGLAVLWVILFHYVVVRDGKFDDPFIALLKACAPNRILCRTPIVVYAKS